MKTAMVWGAGGGIGRALVEKLRGDGWLVVAMGRHTDRVADLTPYRYEADVVDLPAVEQAVSSAGQQASMIDLWIYAVGDIAASKVDETAPETWQQILDANLVGAFLTAHSSLPVLAPDAHLIFLGGVSERLRLPRLSAYAAAKAGLEAFAEVLGKEERKRRVTVVRPSAVDTPLWNKVPFKLPPGTMAPEEAAAQILEAYQQGHQGVLNL
jgi:NAD(P)-dependent dehydrogenase (short-subunit alcohol dehydrogenase family)